MKPFFFLLVIQKALYRLETAPEISIMLKCAIILSISNPLNELL